MAVENVFLALRGENKEDGYQIAKSAFPNAKIYLATPPTIIDVMHLGIANDTVVVGEATNIKRENTVDVFFKEVKKIGEGINLRCLMIINLKHSHAHEFMKVGVACPDGPRELIDFCEQNGVETIQIEHNHEFGKFLKKAFGLDD